VVETYALLLASLLLLYGALNDLYGCQMVFVSGVLLLQLDRPGARLLLRSSPSFRPWPAGIGAASLAPGSLAIISASYMEYELGQPIGSGLASRRSRPPSVRFLVG
jgi:hypothetical protein